MGEKFGTGGADRRARVEPHEERRVGKERRVDVELRGHCVTAVDWVAPRMILLRLRAANERAMRKHESLAYYGRHKSRCALFNFVKKDDPPNKCTCGLSAARDG